MTELRCKICDCVFKISMVQPHTVLCDLQRYDCIGTLTKARDNARNGWCVSIDNLYDTTVHILSVEKDQNNLYNIYVNTEQTVPNNSFIYFVNAMAHVETLLLGYAFTL